MAKKGLSKKDREELRKARREIRREFNKNLSAKDKRDLSKFKCAMKQSACGTGGCFYFLGFFGALVYYITTAPSILAAVIGFFQALFWPAFLVHGLLTFIGA